MKDIAEKLTKYINKLEGVKSKIRGTTTSFTHKLPFASLKLQKDKIELKFTTPSKINHTRLKKVKKLKADKFSHTIIIAKEGDIDSQVNGWIMIAHATN